MATRKHTIVFARGTGEEPSLIGSTEWVETHAETTPAKPPSISTATAAEGSGFLEMGGSHTWEKFINEIAQKSLTRN